MKDANTLTPTPKLFGKFGRNSFWEKIIFEENDASTQELQ